VPRTLLGDNARALVLGRDHPTSTVIFQPAYRVNSKTGGLGLRRHGPCSCYTRRSSSCS
jgi:hypothetical protein